MVPCCRRHHPWRRKTFLDNSEFLRFRPAPTPTSLHNLKAAHLATISKDIHTDSQLQVGKTRKTAVLGRILSAEEWQAFEVSHAPEADAQFSGVHSGNPASLYACSAADLASGTQRNRSSHSPILNI